VLDEMCRRICGGLFVAALTSLLTGSPAAVAACPLDGEAAVVCEVNAERAARSRPPLVIRTQLSTAARRHARDMVARHYFAHTSPSGRTFADRLRAAGYLVPGRRWAAGEVLAWGAAQLSTPAATVAAWMRSPSHRRVLLRWRYREIGVGIARGTPYGAPGATYAAELGQVWR
jgi:uncharacterized protein YkwD